MSDGTGAPVQIENTCPARTRELEFSLGGVQSEQRSRIRNQALSGHGAVCGARLTERTERHHKTWWLIVTVDLNRIPGYREDEEMSIDEVQEMHNKVKEVVRKVRNFVDQRIMLGKLTQRPSANAGASNGRGQREKVYINSGRRR